MIKSVARFLISAVIMMTGLSVSMAQTTIPEILEKGTLQEQMKYLEDRTRIYENYRAIREDMFQLMKKNALDSLQKTKNSISRLENGTVRLNSRIDSLNQNLADTKDRLDEVTRTKNNLKVIGIEINKVAYNSIMWTIVACLLFLLGLGFLIFKRNRVITVNTKKELSELKTEFEEYRTAKRLEREKMSMDHFNEIKKLKGR